MTFDIDLFLVSTNAERETQNHVAKETVTHAQIERNTHDESEADWEGFEAFSSGSESEEVIINYLCFCLRHLCCLRYA